jgi:signal transduction histidine kinase/ligand-binding sensor domain-containing protein
LACQTHPELVLPLKARGPASSSRVALALLVLLPVLRMHAQTSRFSLQQLQHSTWTSRDGLPVTGVFRIERTPDGYLWLSSSAGMLRFDGIRFTLIDSTVSPAVRGSGPSEPWPLVVDYRGAFLFTGRTGELLEYHAGAFRELDTGMNRLLRPGRASEDRQRRIWLVQGEQRHIRQLHDGILVPTGLPAGVPDTGILGVIPDTGGGIWFGTRTQGLWHVSSDNQARRYPVPSSDGGGRPLLQDRAGRLWFLSDGLSMLRDTAWSRITLPGRAKDRIQAIAAAQSTEGDLWFGTRGDGVMRYRNGILEQFSEADGLSDAVVHDLLVDPAGSVWISTDAGLDRLRVAPVVTIDRKLGLPFDSPAGIQEDADGSIWASAYGTGGLFNLDGGLIRRAAGPVRSVDQQVIRSHPFIPLGSNVDGGLWVLDRGTGRLFRYHGGRLAPAAGIAPPAGTRWFSALESPAGYIWVALQPRGFGVIQDGRFRPIELPGQPAPDVTHMSFDPQGRLWVATANPKALYDITGVNQIREVRLDYPADAPGPLLAFEAPDTVWTTRGYEVTRISGGRLASVALPMLAHLLGTASRVLLLENEFLWMASEGGVARVKLADLHRAADGHPGPVAVRLFDERDGLRVGKLSTLSQAPAFRARDGRLWFSTPAGIAVYDPDGMLPNPVPPQPHIERLIVGGAPVPLTAGLALDPNPTRVELHFTVTNLIVPERGVLEYRLDGADREWVRSGPERAVTYAQLRPGPYTFRVRAWNEDGVPATAEATLAFRVLPTWYQTWTFLGFLILLVAGGGAAVFYALQQARLSAVNDKMQARYDATLSERTRLARELHDTLLQGFTGITLQLQAVERSVVEQPREARVSLRRLLTTADLTLREARQVVWDMRAPELDQHDLAEALELAARQAMTDTSIELDFQLNGPRRRIDIGVETTVLRIGREAILNAVKHAAPTTIRVTLHYAEMQLTLLVQDDGRGCDAAMVEAAVEGGHWGIRGMQERAARAGGSLEISGGAAQGTTIRLVIPLSG